MTDISAPPPPTPPAPPATPPIVPPPEPEQGGGGGDPCAAGGCGQSIRNRVDQNRERIDNLAEILAALNAAMNAAQLQNLSSVLGKLNAIDAKLGPQIPGGIGGFLQAFRQKFDKFMDWSRLGRIIEFLTFITVLHNAYMLSNALTQTLFSAIGNFLAVFGIKDEEGGILDINAIVGENLEYFFKSIFGAETVDGTQELFKKANRIYQAAANVVFSIQSIGYSILSALEVVGSYVGKIGNALKKFGVIGERAYQWMNPNPNFQNRFFTNLNNVQDVVENIEQISSEVLDIQETRIQLQKQTEDLDTAVREGIGFITQENQTELTRATQSKEQSQTPPITPESQVNPES